MLRIMLFFLSISFQEVVLPPDVKLIEDFTSEEYEQYYDEIPPRFIGWSSYTIEEDVPAFYVSDTMFSYANQSADPIDYVYTHSKDATVKYKVSVSGDISTSVASKIKAFNVKLQSSIKSDVETVSTESTDEKIKLNIEIKPWSKISLMTKGEAEVTNGVSAFYVFYRPVKLGGWEVIDVKTEYFWLLEEWI